jgi:hypothetical protein
MQVNWPNDKINVYRVMEAMAILHKLPADEYLADIVYRWMRMIADTGGDDVYEIMKEMLENKATVQYASDIIKLSPSAKNKTIPLELTPEEWAKYHYYAAHHQHASDPEDYLIQKVKGMIENLEV